MSPTSFDPARAQTFDAVAENYDASRPGYPAAAIDALMTDACLSSGARVLEVGAGTGKATRDLAARGLSIVAVEPGAQMARIAARHLGSGADVDFEVTTFEDYAARAPHGRFDAVISAQAFHWSDTATRYTHARDLLTDGGHLALIWNRYAPGQTPLEARIDAIYAANAPPTQSLGPPGGYEAFMTEWCAEIEGSGCFGPVAASAHPWEARYDTESYLRLMDTWSDHRIMPADTKKALFDDVAAAIESFGGVLVKRYVAVLMVARRR